MSIEYTEVPCLQFQPANRKDTGALFLPNRFLTQPHLPDFSLLMLLLCLCSPWKQKDQGPGQISGDILEQLGHVQH